jgi:hypothetical protein
MTEQDRIDRETLLRRAAAAAGAVYVAPVLTAGAAAEPSACTSEPCRKSKRCRRRGGKGCKCMDGRCGRADGTECGPRCCGDGGCGPLVVCDESGQCGTGDCACMTNAANRAAHCFDFPSNFCSDYPSCDKSDGHGDCAPGLCCVDTCCPEGICMAPCTGQVRRAPRAGGSGPTVTL